MSFLKRLNEYFAFTKNEQKVFLFLSFIFLSGVAITVYKTYVVPSPAQQFDYAVSDSIFLERSRVLADDSLLSSAARGVIQKVNINSATKSELMSLPGIGEATAERIILYREEHGTFKKISDMKNVKGIGEKKFDNLKPYIEVK
jgi:comEA protein